MAVLAEHRSSAILVLGMHRSGTSALTGLFALTGAETGGSLMPPVEGINPKGFWEHSAIVAVHDEILATLGSSWADEGPLPKDWWLTPDVEPFKRELSAIVVRDFADSSLWVLKDPRICRLLPLWLEILEDLNVAPHFVICLRHPSEVARSLEVRDRIVRTRANLLWLEHLIESERWTRNGLRVVVTYEELVSNWRSLAFRIKEELNLPLKIESADSRIAAFIEPSLRHHNGPLMADADDEASQLATIAYQLATTTNVGELQLALEPIAIEVENIIGGAAPWISQIQRMHHEISELRFHAIRLAQMEAEVCRLKSTVSWRITAPMRAAWNLYRKAIGRLGAKRGGTV